MKNEKKVVLLHPLLRGKTLSQICRKQIVHWCNGSTSDSGSASLGSSPGWTTEKAEIERFRPFFFCFNPIQLQLF